MISNKLVSFSEFPAHSKKVNSICFDRNSKLFASAGKDRILVCHSTSRSVKAIVFKSDCANSIAFSPDSKMLISGEEDGTIKLWSLQTKKLIDTLIGHQKAINSIAVHPNGKLIASGSDDRTIKLWSLKSRQPVCTLTGHTDKVMSVSFSYDGKILASSGDINDKTVKLWFLNEDRTTTLKGHSDWFGGIYSIAFSPDNKLIASGSKDKTIKLWQVATGREIMSLEDHNDDITSIAISPDGKLIASGSKDKTLKLWTLTSGQLVSTVNHHQKIRAVAFGSDSQIATGCSDGKIRLLKPQSKLSSLQQLL